MFSLSLDALVYYNESLCSYIYIYRERERGREREREIEREREREEACNLCKKIPKIKSKRSLIKLWSLSILG